MKSLIIGRGEIGKSLYNVLIKVYDTEIRDLEDLKIDNIEVLHICFPYSKNFIKQVQEYKAEYKPRFTVIHSTVPVGTTRKCGAYHSPIRGIHPYLEKSLKIFVKYLAPKNKELENYFNYAGIPIYPVSKPETTEAMKLYCTTIYGLNIIAEKEMYDFCKKNKLDYKIVYRMCNETYNCGYEKLGFPNFKKYVLEHKKGGIGGHCIVPNCKFLNTSIAKFIIKENKKYVG